MGRVEFHFDGQTRRFVVNAAVSLGDPWGTPPSSLAAWQLVKMIVDSGSNRTAISESAARAIGADVGELDEEPIGGVTGVALRPVLKGVQLRLVGVEAPLHLERVTVFEARVGRLRGGAPSTRGTNILGMDVAMSLRA